MKTFLLLGLFIGTGAFATNRESGGMDGSVAIYLLYKTQPSNYDVQAQQQVEQHLIAAQVAGKLDEISIVRTRQGGLLSCARYKDVMVHRSEFLPILSKWIFGGARFDAPPTARIFAGPSCVDFSKATEIQPSEFN